MKVSFENVGGRFDFGIEAKGNTTYSLPIFSSATPVGAAVSEEVSFGMVLFVDLVISLSEEIDLEAGFEFAFPEGAYVTVDPLAGKIVDHGLYVPVSITTHPVLTLYSNGGETNALPVTVISGSATFKAALRVRVQAGTTVILFGTGFDFELGIFADLIEYQATISSTPACELSITEALDVNVGAFAHAVGEINYSTFGAGPAVVTTILEVPLPSLCLTRPAATLMPALPTDSTIPNISTNTVLPVPSNTDYIDIAPLATHVISTAASSSTGGFFQASSTTSSFTILRASPSIPSSILYTPPVANGTITSAPSLTTSTIYATDIVTLTSCSSNVLHCPASLTTEIVVTSTKILYTTVCAVGITLPSTLPASSSSLASASISPAVLELSNDTLSTSYTTIYLATTILHTTSLALPTTASESAEALVITAIVSPLRLTPCPKPVVETIYVPSFTNPIYIMPTATVFPVPFPDWNITIGFTSLSPSVRTATVSPVAIETSKSVMVEDGGSESTTAYETSKTTLGFVGLEIKGNASATENTTGSLPSATAGLVPFTGGGSRLAGNGEVFLGLSFSICVLAFL